MPSNSFLYQQLHDQDRQTVNGPYRWILEYMVSWASVKTKPWLKLIKHPEWFNSAKIAKLKSKDWNKTAKQWNKRKYIGRRPSNSWQVQVSYYNHKTIYLTSKTIWYHNDSLWCKISNFLVRGGVLDRRQELGPIWMPSLIVRQLKNSPNPFKHGANRSANLLVKATPSC